MGREEFYIALSSLDINLWWKRGFNKTTKPRKQRKAWSKAPTQR